MRWSKHKSTPFPPPPVQELLKELEDDVLSDTSTYIRFMEADEEPEE